MPRDAYNGPLEPSWETRDFLKNPRAEDAQTIAGILWNHVQASVGFVSYGPDRGIWDPEARPQFLAFREADEEMVRLLPDPEESFNTLTDYGRFSGALLNAQTEMIDMSRGLESQRSEQSAERLQLFAEFDAAKERLSEAISEGLEDRDDALSEIQFQFDRKLDAIEEFVELMSQLLPATEDSTVSSREEVKTCDQWLEWAAEQLKPNASSDRCTSGPSFEEEIAASMRLTLATVACLKVLPYRPSGWKSFDAKMSNDLDLRARQASRPGFPMNLWEYPLVLVPRRQVGAEEGDSAITEESAYVGSVQESTA